MKNLLVKFILLLASLWLAPGGANAAAGADLPRADAIAVHKVVQAQLDAFAADDAERAFSFAAPSIRQMFGTAQNFLAMVRSTYAVVHRPASVVFLKPERQQADAIQTVQMTDAQGESWLAVYTLQRQGDKSWRISSCIVVPNQGKAT